MLCSLISYTIDISSQVCMCRLSFFKWIQTWLFIFIVLENILQNLKKKTNLNPLKKGNLLYSSVKKQTFHISIFTQFFFFVWKEWIRKWFFFVSLKFISILYVCINREMLYCLPFLMARPTSDFFFYCAFFSKMCTYVQIYRLFNLTFFWYSDFFYFILNKMWQCYKKKKHRFYRQLSPLQMLSSFFRIIIRLEQNCERQGTAVEIYSKLTKKLFLCYSESFS